MNPPQPSDSRPRADALRMPHGPRPNFKVDGEMQAGTAVVERLVARQPRVRRLHGPANVLIFPDLSAATICDRSGSATT